MAISQEIGLRVGLYGGGALIIDYGHDHPSQFSLQGIKDHKFVDIFTEIGRADISCMVDFAALKKAAKTIPDKEGAKVNANVECFGPITQNEFLTNLSIESRLAILLQNCTDVEKAKTLIASFDRLVNHEQMGSIYKALAIVPTKLNIPPGFQ